MIQLGILGQNPQSTGTLIGTTYLGAVLDVVCALAQYILVVLVSSYS